MRKRRRIIIASVFALLVAGVVGILWTAVPWTSPIGGGGGQKPAQEKPQYLETLNALVTILWTVLLGLTVVRVLTYAAFSVILSGRC